MFLFLVIIAQVFAFQIAVVFRLLWLGVVLLFLDLDRRRSQLHLFDDVHLLHFSPSLQPWVVQCFLSRHSSGRIWTPTPLYKVYEALWEIHAHYFFLDPLPKYCKLPWGETVVFGNHTFLLQIIIEWMYTHLHIKDDYAGLKDVNLSTVITIDRELLWRPIHFSSNFIFFGGPIPIVSSMPEITYFEDKLVT